MFLEIHVLQNFALSNLNRDDTGAPKACTFGGSRRARISSQCLKRAIRTYFREEGLVPGDLLAQRTKQLQRALVGRLTAAGVDAVAADALSTKALEQLDLKLKKGKTEYLLLLGEREMDRLAALCREHAEDLVPSGAKTGKKDEKDGIASLLLAAIDGGDAIDIALFGRMIATHAGKNVDAAVQMAHAFSTHTVANEFDFFSAVDDLQTGADEEGAGAGMLGTTLYNSSCYYRYANLDLSQLAANLRGDQAHLETAVRAFLTGAVHAVPSGKETNSAPQNPPAFMMMVVREKGLWSLANAFVRPIFSGVKGDLVQQSGQQLVRHWNQLAGLYGREGMRYAGFATYLATDPRADQALTPADGVTQEATVAGLIDRVMSEAGLARN